MKQKPFFTIPIKHIEGLDIRNEATCFFVIGNHYLSILDALKKPIIQIKHKDIVDVKVINDILEPSNGKKKIGQSVFYIHLNYLIDDQVHKLVLLGEAPIVGTKVEDYINRVIAYSKDELICIQCNKKVHFHVNKCPYCNKKQVKIINPAFFIVPVVFIMFVAILVNTFPVKDKGLKMIETTLKVDESKANSINTVFDSVGLTNINNITHDEMLDDLEGDGSKGYRVETSFSDNVIMYISKKNNVISIRYADKYFYKKDKPLRNFNDYTMSSDEVYDVKFDAEKRIKMILKNPNSASFPGLDEWYISKDNGVITASSYVDGTNSFNATIRTKFQIKYDKNKTPTSLIFDGVEYN